MLMVAPHAAVVGEAARTTPPPERQRASLQEELAYVLLSVANFSGVVNDFKKAQLAGKFAMQAHKESAELSGGRKDGFFPQRVSIRVILCIAGPRYPMQATTIVPTECLPPHCYPVISGFVRSV